MRYEEAHTLQDVFVNMLRRVSRQKMIPTRPPAVKILDDVSFTIGAGETLGVIGPNGAGKSTILKLAAGIIFPDSGRIKIEGRVAGLLELGAGFHPDLTGRENIFLYASIMGLNRKTIESRLEEIIDFAGLSHFIDIPVKDYSSGMYMRLAFAVASHVDAEVLLIDEVLSVGDTAFRKKGYQRIRDYQSSGGTILLVSHDLPVIERLCQRALLLQNGRIVAEGPARPVIERYLELNRSPEQNGRIDQKRRSDSPLHIVAVRFLGPSNIPCDQLESGSPASLKIWLEASSPISDVVVQVQIYSAGSIGVGADTLAHATNSARHALQLDLQAGQTCVEVAYRSLNLIPGSYYFRVGIMSHELATEYYDVLYGVCPFQVNGSREMGGGVALLPHLWQEIEEMPPNEG